MQKDVLNRLDFSSPCYSKLANSEFEDQLEQVEGFNLCQRLLVAKLMH
jgi:hypothetical protein